MRKRAFRGAKQCNIGANCKNTCIEQNDNCLKEKNNQKVKAAVLKFKSYKGKDSKLASALTRLFGTKPKKLDASLFAKRGIKRIQYVSQQEVLLALGVYGGKNSISSIKSGAKPHPYINFKKVDLAQAQELAIRFKNDNKILFNRLSQMGLRKEPGVGKKIMPKLEKVVLAIAIYLQQDGKSFATGKAVSLNRMSLDHIIPISKGGKNEINNLVLVESSMNYVKLNSDIETFAQILKNKALQVNTPKDLAKLTSAIKAGKPLDAIQKELQSKNRVARLALDIKQAQALVEGVKSKANSVNQFGSVNALGIKNYAQYKDPASINELSAGQLKLVAKAQGIDKGLARWYRGPNTTGTQVEYVSGDAMKAQIALNNGVKYKDLPDAWKKAFKNKYEDSVHLPGKPKVRELLKNDPQPWF